MTTAVINPVQQQGSSDGGDQRCNVLGVRISAVNLDLAAARIESWIQSREPNYVCITGVHGVMESQDNPQLKAIHNAAGMVTPDGMPMVWANRLAGNAHVRRVYGPDLMLKVCGEGVAKGYRHYFYGGGEGVADLLKQKLTEKFPGLQVVGTYCPPFRKMTDDEDRAHDLQPFDDEAIMDDLVANVDRRTEALQGKLDNLDGPIHAGAEAAGGRDQDAKVRFRFRHSSAM